MLAPLVVFWLAAPEAAVGPRAEVIEWAAQRGYRPVQPARVPQPAYTEAVVQEIEGLLEDARALSLGSASSFERLDQLLGEHPELPQAGWWLAERFALEAQYSAQGPAGDGGASAPPDAAALGSGLELVARARGLEGPRAAAVGSALAPEPASSSDGAPLRLLGLRSRDELWLDGRAARAGLQVAPGRHLVQLFRAQRRVWASWVVLGNPPELRVHDPSPTCSELDLWGTQHGARGPVAAPGVRCANWAVASLGARGVDLALCRGSSCGDWEHLEPSARDAAAAAAEPKLPLPAWVTWSALGVGAAAGATLILWQAGAFDRPAPATEFVFTGPTAAAVRF